MKKIALALLLLVLLIPAPKALAGGYDQCGTIIYTGIPSSVSVPAASGSAAVYLTMGTGTRVFIYNGSTVTAKYFFSSLSYPTGTSFTNAPSLAAGSGRYVEGYAMRFLHFFFPTVGASTSIVTVENCW